MTGKTAAVARDLGADCDANFWATWRHIGAHTGTVHEDDEVLIVETGSALATFNPVFVRRVPDDAFGFIRRVVDRSTPVVLIANPSIAGAERLTEAATATGLVQGQLAGMALDRLNGRRAKAATTTTVGHEVSIDIVADGQLHDYFDVLCRGFDIDPSFVERFSDPSMYRAEEVVAFMATIDGTPVATSLTFLHGDVAGIYNVATLPAFRGRGLGTATTAAAAAWGRDRGASVAILQATAMGYPIYRRMGFRSVVPYIQLVVPA